MVVATPWWRVVRWRVGGAQIGSCGVSCGRLGDRLLRGRSIGVGSGRWWLRDAQARTRRWRSVYRSRWAFGGSARRAGWRRRTWYDLRGHPRGAISRLPSGRRSRCCGWRGWACGRWRAGLGGRRRPSRGSCGETRRPGAGSWTTARRRRSGTPRGRRVVRNVRSWRRTRPCGPTLRNGSPVWSSRRAGLRCPGRRCPGRSGGTGDGSTGVGGGLGARSRSPNGCGSTTRKTRRCASATRRSIRRSTCKAGER